MKRFLHSLRFALHGTKQFFFKEKNGQIQILFGAAAILLGTVLSISSFQWLFVLFCTGFVISLEMLNTAIEKYCDLVSTGFHPGIKLIKDVSAGAVLVASVFSLIIGLIIFIPAIADFLNKFL